MLLSTVLFCIPCLGLTLTARRFTKTLFTWLHIPRCLYLLPTTQEGDQPGDAGHEPAAPEAHGRGARQREGEPGQGGQADPAAEAGAAFHGVAAQRREGPARHHQERPSKPGGGLHAAPAAAAQHTPPGIQPGQVGVTFISYSDRFTEWIFLWVGFAGVLFSFFLYFSAFFFFFFWGLLLLPFGSQNINLDLPLYHYFVLAVVVVFMNILVFITGQKFERKKKNREREREECFKSVQDNAFGVFPKQPANSYDA